ncbi:TetR/AcrR family transcriptional regulator [Streptomyces sp. NPDC051954]|uniref:TetR/AcrR family transcriptional regulator n=1 Tax=unclassified Streptomyces TaxID=2593676 RepID=UPI0034417F01
MPENESHAKEGPADIAARVTAGYRESADRPESATAPGAGKRRGPYAKTKALRGEIVDAALAVFGRTGYRAGSIREIAEIVGLTQAGVLHHFENKEALLTAVLTRRDEQDAALLAGRELIGIGALATLVDLARHHAARRGMVQLFTVLSAEANADDHPAHEYFHRRYEWYRTGLVRVYAAIGNDGGLRPGVDPDYAAAGTLAMMDGLQTQWLQDPEKVDMAATLEAYFRVLLTEEAWETVNNAAAPPR